MAVTFTLSNHYRYQIMNKQISFPTDVFKIIQMTGEFVFNEDNHATYADVSGEELLGGTGYTVGGQILLSGELTEDDSINRGRMAWAADPIWTANGGSLGTAGSAIIIDDTTNDDTVVGCIKYGASYDIADGFSLEVRSIIVDV